MADMPHLNGGFRQNRLVHTSHYSLTKGLGVGRRAWAPNYHCHLVSTAEKLLRTSIRSPHSGFRHDGPSIGAPTPLGRSSEPIEEIRSRLCSQSCNGGSGRTTWRERGGRDG